MDDFITDAKKAHPEFLRELLELEQKLHWRNRTNCSVCGAEGEYYTFDDSGRCADCTP